MELGEAGHWELVKDCTTLVGFWFQPSGNSACVLLSSTMDKVTESHRSYLIYSRSQPISDPQTSIRGVIGRLEPNLETERQLPGEFLEVASS
jgi:hypothetical protein